MLQASWSQEVVDLVFEAWGKSWDVEINKVIGDDVCSHELTWKM